MAKMAKKPPLGGIINIYKPAGPSSFNIVGLARKLLDVKKIGFDGTLDPFAEGVLPLYIGRACAAIVYNEKPNKEYISLLALGASTDSQDSTGEILRYEYLSQEFEKNLIRDDCVYVRKKLCEFLGEQKQEVPAFSAAKFNGKRFVDLYRDGAEVPKRFKDIEVLEAELLDYRARYDFLENSTHPAYANFSYPNKLYQARMRSINENLIDRALGPFFLLKHKVSSGTYIRTLNQDLASELGTFGTTLRLLRTRHGNFDIKDAISVDEFATWCKNGGKEKVLKADFDNVLMPIDSLFTEFPMLRLSDENCIKLLQGRKISVGELENFAYNLSVDSQNDYCEFYTSLSTENVDKKNFIKVYSSDRFIGLAYIFDQQLVAERMFLGIEDF